MSIKNQKILQFFPVINLLTLVFWGKLFFEKRGSFSSFFKRLGLIFFLAIIITIPLIVVSRTNQPPWLTSVLQIVVNYFRLFIFATNAIKAQEELLNQK